MGENYFRAPKRPTEMEIYGTWKMSEELETLPVRFEIATKDL